MSSMISDNFISANEKENAPLSSSSPESSALNFGVQLAIVELTNKETFQTVRIRSQANSEVINRLIRYQKIKTENTTLFLTSLTEINLIYRGKFCYRMGESFRTVREISQTIKSRQDYKT